MLITFSSGYNSSSLRLSDTLAIPKQNVCTHEIGQRIPVMVKDALRLPTMGETYLEVLGCLGAAFVILLGRKMDFRTVDAFEIGLDTGFILVLVNLKGTGRAGAPREPIDTVLAAFETLQHMLDFKSSVSCFGFG